MAIGKLFVYKKAAQVVDKRAIEDPQAEMELLYSSILQKNSFF